MFKFKKSGNKYVILNNQKKISMKNNLNFYVKSKQMALKIVDEINNVGYFDLKKLPITSLAFFSVNLDSKDKKDVISYLTNSITFDNTLYRPANDETLKNLMDKEYNHYISSFSRTFSMKLNIKCDALGYQKDLCNDSFEEKISSYDCFSLALFYKLTKMTNSVILSYYFMLRKYGIKKLDNLTNLERHYQNINWGLTTEQEIENKNFLLILKNFSIFLKTF